MDGWITEVLKSNGLAGAFISVLLLGIAALWQMLRSKDRQLKELYAQRATEREALVKLVEVSNAAALAVAAATERRNQIMGDLGGAVTAQAGAIERYEDRVASQAEIFREKFSDIRLVVSAASESSRTLTGVVTDLRNEIAKMVLLLNLPGGRA